MALDIKAALRKISEAQVNGGGNYIRGGTHLLELQNVLFEQKRGGLCFIGEFIVRESAATHVDHEGKDIAPHKPGEIVSTVIKFEGNGADMAGVNVKALICGLFGSDPASITDEEIEQVLVGTAEQPGIPHKSQPARGMLVKCVGVPGLTKARKVPFVKLNWYSVAQEPAEIQARRAAQESGKAAA